ncbi:MAG TPA: MT-A70 family methyltransferase [Kofleriaceae bacterium]|nr:MT-A70 family methyltransferase [Kofleriaceae bacterium]
MKRFALINADPPWQFADRGSRIAPDFEGRHYKTKSLKEILEVDGPMVWDLARANAVLALWAPNVFVADGTAKRVCQAWDFEPKQLVPWVKRSEAGKLQIGMGHYTRCCTEMLVLATRGRVKVQRHDIPGLIEAPRGRHSAKPDESYELLQKLFKGPYLELYARRQYNERWTVWGDQI